jgi:hypothetical protein
MKIVRNPFEPRVYMLVGAYEEYQIGSGQPQYRLREEAIPMCAWLHEVGRGKWRTVGYGMIRIDDPVFESLFVMRWS